MPNPNQIEKIIIKPEQAKTIDQVEAGINPSTEPDPNALAAESDKVFSRQHADGTVHEGSADVARQECTAFQGKTLPEVMGAISLAELGKEMRAAAKLKSAPAKQKLIEKERSGAKDTPVELIVQQIKVKVVASSLLHPSIVEAQSGAGNNQEIALESIRTPHKDVFEQIVRLDQIAESSEDVLAKPIPELSLEPTALPEEKNPADIATEKAATLVAENSSFSITDTIPQTVLTEQNQSFDSIGGPAGEDLIATDEVIFDELTPIRLVLNESDQGEIPTYVYPTIERPILLETESVVAPEQGEVGEGDTSIFASELFEPVTPSETLVQAEKTPAAVAAEFMIKVFPAVTQEAYERVQEMEPVEAAEVAAQIETISIVADRLHELVVQGKTDGEEAQQIEAYLKREYEQLLVSVGIEPTQEILNEFIRYVYSADYQIQAKLNMNDIEVIDEGTHEKKLFDEQSVFARARAASVKLSRRLDKTIGQLVVNYSNL